MEGLENLNRKQIVAVSKLQPIEKIRKLYQDGFQNFGENYVQEALDKIEQTTDLKIDWHFIGKLQKNKIKYIIGKFKYIHSIESIDQIQILDQRTAATGVRQNIFLQVNVADESTKSGFTIAQLESEFERIRSFKNINVVGLMTMPPLTNSGEENRIHFKTLKQLATKLNLKELSMGTSHDYKIALEEGATWVRLGTVLFGERKRE